MVFLSYLTGFSSQRQFPSLPKAVPDESWDPGPGGLSTGLPRDGTLSVGAGADLVKGLSHYYYFVVKRLHTLFFFLLLKLRKGGKQNILIIIQAIRLHKRFHSFLHQT